jgi:hypothetical protein
MNEHASENVPPLGETVAPRKRRRWRTVALGLIILLCGALLGSGATIIVVKHFFDVVHTPGAAAKRITAQMRRKLDLSDEQTAKVRAILLKRESALRAIFAEMQPRLEEQLQRAREEVAAVLDPEQARDWQRRFDRMEERWKRRWPSATAEKKEEE